MPAPRKTPAPVQLHWSPLHSLLCVVFPPRGIQLHCWKALRPVARRSLNFYAHGGRLGPRELTSTLSEM